MQHLVLLGDSIFDNGQYVRRGEPDVGQQVRRQLPPDWNVTLLAVDGHRIGDIAAQLARLPFDATHIAVSIGGNDTLDMRGILAEPSGSVAQTVERLAVASERFENAYRSMLASVLARNLPTAICTIYEGCNANARLQRINATALRIFNDSILRAAILSGIPVLDLRLVCSLPHDYANPIEPSAIGGDKIAAGIVQIMTGHDFSGGSRQFYGCTADLQ